MTTKKLKGGASSDAEQPITEITPRVNSINRDLFMGAMKKCKVVLQQLGFESLRPGQDRAVYNLFCQKDTICLLPTGGGKSLIYILPTLCLDWKCLIFSPLVSLMKDQVESLWKMKLSAAQVSSGQENVENKMALMSWENGELQFLLVAPERLESESFRELMIRVKPNMIVVDEAHCLSQWATTFRPSYTRIGDLIQRVVPDTVLCLTATATAEMEEDIRKILGVQEADRIVYLPKRDNLILTSDRYPGDIGLLRQLNELEGSIIVYSLTRRRCDELYAKIGREIKGGALIYHGELTSSERDSNQNLFMRNEVRVMFATNAFGMGVNKPDIRGIVHRDMPRSVEAYTQEVGRAGRDGQTAACILYVQEDALDTIMFFINSEYPDRSIIQQTFSFVNRMKDADNTLTMSIEDIAAHMNIRQSRSVGSALAILSRFKVLERNKSTDSVFKVRPKKTHLDMKLQTFINGAMKFGVQNSEGYYEFQMVSMVQGLKVPDKRIRDNLQILAKNGYIDYVVPFRGSTTRVIGDIGLVDFEVLDRKRNESVQKMNQMVDYFETPDELKHDFLLDYFGVSS